MSDDFSFCEVSIQVLLNIIRLRTCFIFIMCVQTRSRKQKDEQKEGKYRVFVLRLQRLHALAISLQL